MASDNYGSKILAQSRPSGTSAASIYSPATNRRAILSKIIISNTTGSAAAASVYVDDDGTTYTQATSILFGKSIAANDSEAMEFEDGLELGEDGNVAVQTGTGSALTFTILGRALDT